MNGNLSKIVVDKVLSCIPPNYAPVEYLIDILQLSRDSVYRRLNFKKSFTIDEIVKLSSNLGFSIDEIVRELSYESTPDKKEGKNDVNTTVLHLLTDVVNLAKECLKDNDSEIIYSIGHPSMLYAARFNKLFKFLYFKSLHQMREIPATHKYSDVSVPGEILSKLTEFADLTYLLRNVSLIIDQNIYKNLIKDIQYFYKRKLISDEEIDEIEKDLTHLVDEEAANLQKSYKDTGVKYNCYLSLLSIETDVFYLRYKNKEIIICGAYFIEPISITNTNICELYGEWLYSQKRYSTLITGVNEDILTNFFTKQHEYINNIRNI